MFSINLLRKISPVWCVIWTKRLKSFWWTFYFVFWKLGALICPVYRFSLLRVFPGEADIRNHFRHIWIGQCLCVMRMSDSRKRLQWHRNDQGQTLILNLKNIIQYQIHPEYWSRAHHSQFRRSQAFSNDLSENRFFVAPENATDRCRCWKSILTVRALSAVMYWFFITEVDISHHTFLTKNVNRPKQRLKPVFSKFVQAWYYF